MVSKPPNADHSTRNVHESIMHCDIEFMSNEQSSKVTRPCKSAFDGPSSAIKPKLAAVLRRCSFSIFTMGTNQIPFRLLEPFTKRTRCRKHGRQSTLYNSFLGGGL